MCGIAGFAGAGSKEQLQRMTNVIKHRGPDDEGFYVADGIGMGFRRLSIIDVSGGHQPLSNEDGTVWVIMNGEIYGYQSVRAELEASDHVFHTKSDTEVIAHAYEQWGDDCFKYLNGMFAIAIWDVRKKRLIIARDRLGKKPLYWTIHNQTLWFASELKSLVASGVVKREIDPLSLACYFQTDAVPTPHTIFKNVFKLEPATAMSWQGGQIQSQWKFWQPEIIKQEDRGAKQVLQGLQELIDIAVRERLVADVPLGLFLSGGLDSAVIAESASRQANRRLQAFTIGFDDKSHDESIYAKQTAEALGLDHYLEILSASDALQMIDQAQQLLDEPLADASILPQLLVSKFTRQHVTVALSGDGGDELLLGYQHVPAHQLLNIVPRRSSYVPRLLARMLNSVPAGDGYFSLGFKAQRMARGLGAPDAWARDVRWRGAMTGNYLQNLLQPEFASQIDTNYAEQSLRSRASELLYDVRCTKYDSFWPRWSYAYLRTFLMDEVLVKVDRATMWYALEARAPFLDTRVVEYLLNVPNKYKLGAYKGKRLFKELLRGKVPEGVLSHPKHGFAAPVGAWLNGPLKDRLAGLSSKERLQNQGVFNPKSVQDMIVEHASGKIDRRKELWAFFMFQLWYDAGAYKYD
ncbi:MAG: Asparagine synthetase (glutamine-hydrolyzing) 1 [Parcubacteria group bacterium ADurb.Bin192]|nr:MAG: Asparagine synthetase (glutamine-hydrolyzing) 1 [Parcubacteria group bacterium ADurb.Bin192]